VSIEVALNVKSVLDFLFFLDLVVLWHKGSKEVRVVYKMKVAVVVRYVVGGACR
jgi:hypothetical protein